MKKVLITFMFILSVGLAKSQYYSCEFCGTPYVWTEEDARAFFLEILSPVHDTILDTTFYYVSNLDSITKIFGMSFDEFVRRFLANTQELDTTAKVPPEYIYFNYFLPMLQTENSTTSEKRWISEIFKLYITPTNAFDYREITPYRDYIYSQNENADLLFVCLGDENTNLFVKSKNLINDYLVKIFEHVHHANKTSSHKIKGLNFYFPDYNFKANREMAQFAKSVSLFIDSTKLETIRGMQLYFSFDAKKENKKGFLCCLTEMCDKVFLFNKNCDTCLFYPYRVYNADSATHLPVFYKIKDQLLLARFSMGKFPQNTSETEFVPADIIAIVNSDYPNNDWESYLIALLIIIAIVLLIVTLYWTIPEFSYYLNKNKNYMIILILIFIFEVFLLFFTTIEAMSRTNVFNFSDKDKYMILFIPLLMLFITPVVKTLRRKKNLP